MTNWNLSALAITTQIRCIRANKNNSKGREKYQIFFQRVASTRKLQAWSLFFSSAHKRIVIDRLIELLKHANILQKEAISKIVSDWVAKGHLDNSIIDMFWNYFLKKVDVTDEQSLGALELLGMASLGNIPQFLLLLLFKNPFRSPVNNFEQQEAGSFCRFRKRQKDRSGGFYRGVPPAPE